MRLSKTIADTITGCLVPLLDPAKIIVFGSYARGEATDDSDIDIAVIAGEGQPADMSTITKGRVALRRALKGTGLAFDFVMQSREMFESSKSDVGSIWRSVNTEGLVLYEQ